MMCIAKIRLCEFVWLRKW